MAASLRVTQIKSTIGHIARNRATMKALGLHGIGSSVDVVDNEATRGMVRQVRFLVAVEEPSAGTDHAAARKTPVRGSAEQASNAADEGTSRVSGDAQETS